MQLISSACICKQMLSRRGQARYKKEKPAAPTSAAYALNVSVRCPQASPRDLVLRPCTRWHLAATLRAVSAFPLILGCLLPRSRRCCLTPALWPRGTPHNKAAGQTDGRILSALRVGIPARPHGIFREVKPIPPAKAIRGIQSGLTRDEHAPLPDGELPRHVRRPCLACLHRIIATPRQSVDPVLPVRAARFRTGQRDLPPAGNNALSRPHRGESLRLRLPARGKGDRA